MQQRAYMRVYAAYALENNLTGFGGLAARAEEIATAEFARFSAQPAGEDFDGDLSQAAEKAEELGQAFYDEMSAIQQTVLNLMTVGLFHLLEQQLADVCRDASFVNPLSTEKTKLDPSLSGITYTCDST